MTHFRKKPVVIEAVQWSSNWPQILEFVVRQGGNAHVEGSTLVVETLEGDMTAQPDDWIVRGVRGEFYPVKDAIFQETYELVEE